jgi:O-antigen/teichoic acid export membrane protein
MPSNSETPLPTIGAPAPKGNTGFMARLSGHSGDNTVIRQRLGSIAHLLTGNVTNAVIMLIGTVVAARTLGASAYGVFALVLTVCRISERLLRFESWQPLIRFAAHEEISGDPQRRSQLFLYGLLLDVSSAVLAAFLAVTGGYFLMPLLNLKPEHLPLIAIYAVAISVNIRGMPTAALRLSGQFKTLAYVQIFSSLLRLSLASLALIFKADLLTFVVIWTVAQMIDSLLFLGLGFRALKSLGIPNPLRAELRGMTTKFPSFMKFAWSTNISSGLRTLTQEADTLMVGAFAGTSAAGFYHIAKRMAKVAQQVGDMVQAVLYPDMARLWAKSEIARFRHLVGRIQLALAAVGLALLGACWLVGNWLINLFFGQEFAAAYPLLIAQLIAVILIMHAAPSRSALLAMNRPGLILVIATVSTGLFFAVAFVAMPIYGAIGANFAHIAFAALTAIALDFAWWRGSREQIGSRTTVA